MQIIIRIFAENYSIMQIYIFISYGHDDYAERAKILYEELSKNEDNFVIWWDHFIEPSAEWVAEIESHLNELVNNNPNSCFVYVVTPYSSNTERDNFCIKEIVKAVSGSVRLIPIKVVETPMPLLLGNIQWLDFTKCIFDSNNQEFVNKVEELRQIIREHKELPLDGKLATILNRLEPCKFSLELAKYLENYEPREWLLDKIKQWMNAPDNPLLLLLGGPGTGKTAFSVWMSYGELSQHVVAWHLCQYNDKRTCILRNVVKSLVSFLATRLPEYYEILDVTLLDKNLKESDFDAGTLFKALILEPLQQIEKHDGIQIILIDALDEASFDSYNELAEMLANYSRQLPKWIKFVITSRNDFSVTTHLADVSTIINLDDKQSREQSTEDISRYVNKMIEGDPSMADYVVQESENNFLYAQLLCNTIKDNPDFVSGKLPKGINNYYNSYMLRYFKTSGDFDFKTYARPLLNIMLTAFEPLSTKDLYNRLHETCDWCEKRSSFHELITCFGPLLTESADSLRPYHKSLSDWFLDNENNKSFFISKEDGLDEMICWGLEVISDEDMTPKDFIANHFYRYLPQYMIEAEDKKAFTNLYTDIDFWKRRQEMLGTDLLLRSLIDELSLCKESVRRKLFEDERFFKALSLFSVDLFNTGLYISLRRLGYTIPLVSGMDDDHRLFAVRYYYICELYNDIEDNISVFEEPYKDLVVEAMVMNELGQTYRKLGLLTRSVEFYRKSLEKAIASQTTQDERIYTILNISRVLNVQCKTEEAREMLQKAVDLFDSGCWKNSLQGTDSEFSARQLERAVRYVVQEMEDYSIKLNQEVFVKAMKWGDEIYADPIKRDRYYPNHLLSKIFFRIRTGNLDNIEELMEECRRSIVSHFDGIRFAYQKVLLLILRNQKAEAIQIASEQLEALLPLRIHQIERTEFAAVTDWLTGEDHISVVSKELLPWYHHTCDLLNQISSQ